MARKMGLTVVIMGDVIRQEAAHLGLEPTDENLGKVGNMLRSREGPEAIAKRTLNMAEQSGKDIVVVDGIRSKAEVDFFRANSEDFHLVEVWTPPEARLNRIVARGRRDDANSKECKEALEKREHRELGWGMCDAIREADLRVNNEGDLDKFRTSVRKLLEDIVSGKVLQSTTRCT